MANKSAFYCLPWQQGVWSRLQQARRQDRLPHAMLFALKGWGKKILLLRLPNPCSVPIRMLRVNLVVNAATAICCIPAIIPIFK